MKKAILLLTTLATLCACAQTPHTSKNVEAPIAETQPTPIPDDGYDVYGRPFHFIAAATQSDRRNALEQIANNPLLAPGAVIPTHPPTTVIVRQE